MADKESKKQAEMRFAGQDTDDAKTAVRRQRELKKKKDALRKCEKKLKTLKPEDAGFADAMQEINEVKLAIANLEAPDTPSPPSPDPVPPPVEPAAPAKLGDDGDEAALKAREKDEKKKAEMQLAGQDGEGARTAVKQQRELKRKKDALRKTQKKMKSMKPEDADYAAAKEEEAQLVKEIAALEGVSASVAAPAAAPSAAAPAEAPPSASPATSAMSASTTPAAHKDPRPQDAEDVEKNAAVLRQMVERCLMESRGTMQCRLRGSLVHPRIAEFAVMSEEMLIVGGNARTLAMISAFREMFRTTTILSGTSLKDVDSQAFTELVEANFAFLRRRREASSGMRYVKEVVVRRLVALRDELVQRQSPSAPGHGHPRDERSALQSSALESFAGDAREVALQILDLIESEIRMSVKSIVEERSLPYVSSTDTILVFGRSSVVEFILLSRVHDPSRKPKKVIVVDSAPLYEGRELAGKLSAVGIDVTYGLITATCTLMPKCTRVFIGASSVLQNGDVFGRCGTALIATCAKTFRKPVLCFAESYKFVAEVWLGNLAQNAKLVDMKTVRAAHDGGSRSPLAHSTSPSFSVSGGGAGGSSWPLTRGQFTPPLVAPGNGGVGTAASPPSAFGVPFAAASSAASGYLYDLTPAAYVDMIICEMGCLHTSAIIAAIKDREGRDASPAMYFGHGRAVL